MSSSHHLKLFGIPELIDPDGNVVRLRTRKQLGLLVYLALEARRRPVARETLVDLLWPDASPERGRHSLSQSLSAIRRRLGRQSLSRSRETVQLLGGLSTDLDDTLRQTRHPEDLTKPLQGLDRSSGTAFAHWIDATRARCVQAARTQLLGELSKAQGNGKVRLVHECAALLYRVDPFSSEAALALAEHHLLEGNEDAALRLLENYKRRAPEDSEGKASPEVDRLLMQLGQDRHRRSCPPEATSPFDNRSEYSEPVIVDRAIEQARLEAVWRRVLGGKPQLCTLVGSAGLGKTTLLRQFCHSVAARAWPVFSCACQEIGAHIPFATITDLVVELSEDPGFGAVEPHVLAEVSKISPALRHKYPGIPDPRPAPSEAARLRLADSLLRVIHTVSDGRPTLIAFDDLQHIDAASRDVLHLICRRVESLPVMFLAAARKSTMAQIAGPSTTLPDDEIELLPLTRNEGLRLLAVLLKGTRTPAPVMRTIISLAQGNPYFLELLAADWQRNQEHSLVAAETESATPETRKTPTDTMRLAFRQQNEDLPELAHRVLQFLAVAGRAKATEEFNILSADIAWIDETLITLLDRGILRVENGAVGFKSQVHRAFVYHSMSPDLRRFYHARIAQTVVTQCKHTDFQNALEASQHFGRAGMVDAAAESACRGSGEAIRRGAPKEAERALRNAITKKHNDPRLYMLLAQALSAQGQYRECLTVLAKRRGILPQPRDEVCAVVMRAEALHRGRLDNDLTIRSTANLALKLAQLDGDEALIMTALQTCAEVASDQGDGRAVANAGRCARVLAAESRQDQTAARARLTVGFSQLMRGGFKQAIQSFTGAMERFAILGAELELLRALNGVGFAHAAVGEYPAAIGAFRRAVHLARQIGDLEAEAILCSNVGIAYGDLGRFAAGRRWLMRALTTEAAVKNPRRAAQIYLNVASINLAMGNLDETIHNIDAADHDANVAQMWKLKADVLLLKADVEALLGNVTTAWKLLEQVQDIAAGRVDWLFSSEKYERLRRYRHWKEYGFASLTRRIQRCSRRWRCKQLVKRLELKAFDEWVRVQEEIPGASLERVLREIQEARLYGLISFLRVIGIASPS